MPSYDFGITYYGKKPIGRFAIRYWLIRFLVGQDGCVMNVKLDGDIERAGDGRTIFIHNANIEWERPKPSLTVVK